MTAYTSLAEAYDRLTQDVDYARILDFLETLPEDWRMDGMGEVLKYAVLGDANLFAKLEKAASASRVACLSVSFFSCCSSAEAFSKASAASFCFSCSFFSRSLSFGSFLMVSRTYCGAISSRVRP